MDKLEKKLKNTDKLFVKGSIMEKIKVLKGNKIVKK
jgi:hypothetical protein